MVKWTMRGTSARRCMSCTVLPVHCYDFSKDGKTAMTADDGYAHAYSKEDVWIKDFVREILDLASSAKSGVGPSHATGNVSTVSGSVFLCPRA